jgi:hypothetical protein
MIVVSTDCHAGLHIADYKPYVESKYHEMLDMAVPITVDMLEKSESMFLIKEINDAWRAPIKKELTGAWDYRERLNMLAGDGIAAEIIFPDGITEKNTPPFGAGLGLSPRDMVPELQWAGAMAHNRWLAELLGCAAGGRSRALVRGQRPDLGHDSHSLGRARPLSPREVRPVLGGL